MTKGKYTHYKEYFKKYLGAWSFLDGDEVLTIKHVEEREMYDIQTGKMKTAPCIWVEEKELPMVLNQINGDTIAEVLGTGIIEEWIGQRIIVGTETVKAFGKETEAIRVRNRSPKPKPKISEQQLTAIRDLIENGAVNEAKMLKFYGIGRIEDMNAEDAYSTILNKTGEVVE